MQTTDRLGAGARIAGVGMCALPLLAAGCSGPRWGLDGAAAFRRASRDNRPVLTYYSTAACQFSARMEREVFSDPQIVERLDQFELLRRDFVLSSFEARRFGITGTPGFVVRRPDGTVMGTPAVGYMNTAEFRAFLASSLLQR